MYQKIMCSGREARMKHVNISTLSCYGTVRDPHLRAVP